MWSEDTQREIDYFVCDDEASLLYVVNLGTIPLHLWASRAPTLERPDWCVLDLDPKGAPFEHVVEVARAAKELCDRIGLPVLVKTTGSSGLHLLIPLGRQCTHEQSRSLGELLARCLVERLPEIATIVRQVPQREGKVYVDYLQNGSGKLIVAPFSVRPLPGAPVSVPLAWREVNRKLDIRKHTIKTVPERMRKLKTDPLAEVLELSPDLGAALERLMEELRVTARCHGHPDRRRRRSARSPASCSARPTPGPLYVLAHGAGAGHAAPLHGGHRRGARRARRRHAPLPVPLRRAGSRRPDPPGVLEATVRAAVAKARELAPDLPLVAGGKSMGGRMTSNAMARRRSTACAGSSSSAFRCIRRSSPGSPAREHLDRVQAPMLFLQGTRDTLADLELITAVCERLGARATLHVVEGADHSFAVLKRSGRTDARGAGRAGGRDHRLASRRV